MNAIHSLIDGATKMTGLIGRSISYSLSPVIHNTAIVKLGLNQVYVPLDVPDRPSLEALLKAMAAARAVGFNVTQPWKNAVAEIITGDATTPVNTIVLKDGQWIGTSTDAEGFVRGLERIGRCIGDFKSIVILGAGGAAQSLCARFQTESVEKISILARHREKVQAWATQRTEGTTPVVGTFDLTVDNLARELSSHPECLLIQATSAPLQGHLMSDLLPALDKFNGTFVDLVYGQPSGLFHRCLSMGLPAQDGEAMLIEQARLSQEIWWGRSASWEILAAALRDHKRRQSTQA